MALEMDEQAEYQRRAFIHFANVPWADPVNVPDEIAYTTRDFVIQCVCQKTAAVKSPLYALVPLGVRGNERRVGARLTSRRSSNH